MGEVVEFPYGFDGTKHATVGGKPELVQFLPRARYGGHRAIEAPSPQAKISLLSQGCVDYTGPVLYWIPENVIGEPSVEDWTKLLTEAWDHVPDEVKKRFAPAPVQELKPIKRRGRPPKKG